MQIRKVSKMKEWIKRQWCRSGLHKWGKWSGIEKDIYQYRSCVWCNYGQARDASVYSIGEILMEFAKRGK
jgi:hypothetical protein